MNKVQISVSIIAYNEEQNIKQLINSVLQQNQNYCELRELLIILDGCTDNTYQEASQIKDSRIKIQNNSDRTGKSLRMNSAIKLFNGDILVILDADIIMSENNVLDEVAKKFDDPNVGLVCVTAKPVKPKSFVARAINTSVEVYTKTAENMNKGENIFTCKGVLLALSRKFTQTISFTPDIYAYDTYLYFQAISKNFGYRYCNTTFVSYQLPLTVKDHIKQNARFMGARENISKYFDQKIIDREFTMNRKVFLNNLLVNIVQHPILSLSIFLINKLSNLYLQSFKNNIDAKWSISNSTKHPTNNSFGGIKL